VASDETRSPASAGPRLIVFAGLPGTGKTTLSREVARSIGAVLLRVDTIESAILRAGVPPSFETGLAAYVVAEQIASEALLRGQEVVVDAVNGVAPAREAWRALAMERGARRLVIELRCPDPAEHRRRVEARNDHPPLLPRPSWADVTAREYLPWAEPVLSLDSTRPFAECLQEALRYCGASPRIPPVPGVRGRGDRRSHK
jgi:predicted kinase